MRPRMHRLRASAETAGASWVLRIHWCHQSGLMSSNDNKRVASLYELAYVDYLGSVPRKGSPPLLGTVRLVECFPNFWVANCFAGESLDATKACFEQVTAYSFAILKARGTLPDVWIPRYGHQVDDVLLYEIAALSAPQELQLVIVT